MRTSLSKPGAVTIAVVAATGFSVPAAAAPAPPVAVTVPAPAAPARPVAVTAPAASSATRIVNITGLGAFVTPTGNITCAMYVGPDAANDVRCDILSRRWRPSARPAWCDLDWGHGFGLQRRASLICAGDTVFGTATLGQEGTRWFSPRRGVRVKLRGAPAMAGLKYGVTMRAGRLDCTVTTKGVTCTNRGTKHGFFVSRDRYRVF